MFGDHFLYSRELNVQKQVGRLLGEIRWLSLLGL